MNYEQFLEMFQGEDSELTRQAYQEMFGVAPGESGIMPLKNLGFEPPEGGITNYRTIQDVALDRTERGVHGRLGPKGDKVFYDHPALHDKITGPAGDYREGIIDRGGEAYEREGRNYLVAQDKFYNQDNWLSQKDPYQYSDYHSAFADLPVNPEEYVTGPSGLPGPLDSTSVASTPSLLSPSPTGAIGPQDSFAVSSDPSLYGGSESALTADATATATDSATGLSGPQMFAANMALNFIPTRDREKVDTPIGDKGSKSGILKGAGKGALTGYTLSGGNPYGALAGGVLGAYGGTQGYFDSTTPPSIQIARIKRGGGSRMPQGLLGGGMYA